MGQKEIIKTKNILFKLFRNRNISVDKIVIYGSYARGVVKAESDIDVMVISRDFRGKDFFQKVAMVRGIHSDIVKQINKPVDLLYYSDKEWEKGTSIIVNAAKYEGIVFTSKQ
jgi:predicted nucleotidyltransferase